MVQTKEDGLTENGQMTLSSGVGNPAGVKPRCPR